MKRLLSLFLLTAVLFTMCMGSFEAFAARTYLINQEGTAISFASSSAYPTTKKEVDGVYGRAKGDTSVYTSRTASNSYVNTSLTSIDITKDLIIESSFIPGDNVKNVALGTASNGSIGIGNVALGNFNANQWNKYKTIINPTTKEATVYVNGKSIASYTYSGLTNDTFRFIFNPTSTSVATEVYMDYLYVYQETTGVETGVEAMPVSASGEGYTLESDTLTLNTACTVTELKATLGIAETTSVRVYSDNTYGTQLAESSTIADGNVAVLQTEDNLFQYLNLDINDGTELIYYHDGSTKDNILGSITQNILDGYKGKSAEDKVISYSRESTSGYFRPVDGLIDTSKVLIVEMQFLTGDTITSFKLGSKSNAKIANALGGISSSNFNLNRWNNLKAVIDFTNNKASLYFNNIKISSSTAITFDNTSTGGLRFIFEGTSPVEICFDNIKMYETIKTFEEVDTGFTYPVTASGTGYTYDTVTNTIDFGEYKTLADIKSILNLESSTDVRGYTADFASQLADTDTLSGGNLLVIEKASGEIQTVKIASLEPTDDPTDLYYNDGSKAAYGTSSSIVKGAKGRAADDTSLQVSKSATSGLIWYGTPTNSLSITNTHKDLVYEYSFVPPEGMTDLLLAHSQSNDVGPGKIPASAFIDNAWNKVKLVWNLSTNKGEVFINGKIYANDINMIDAVPTELRTVFYLDGSEETPYMYMDEIHVYVNDIGFESEEEYYLLEESGDDYMINHDTMTYIGDTITVSAFKTAFADDDTTIRIYSEDYVLLDNSAILITGDRIVIEAPNNIITTYTFEKIEENKIYLKGEGYYSDAQFVSKPIDVTVLTDGAAVLVAAQFNEDGKMTDLETKNVTEAGWLKYTYTPADANGKVKLMLLDSLATAKPLAEKVELGYRQSLSVLIIGNSFSTDSLKYLREIAEADGVEINVGRLIKGGSNLQHHYDTRETTEDVNVLHYNGVSTGYTNLKTVLSDYDWDYVAIQNWSSKYYTELDDSFWTVADDLVKYVNEKEPDAEILINKTWSFEKGYSYGSTTITEEVQTATDNYLTEKTEMIAKSAGEAIGTDALRIVPAGDAFTVARNYTNSNGVNIFDTTYYKDGHSFTSDMNKQTIEVGQGILSPEEEDAGYIRLHRDGFHSSLLARYMLASVWYEALTGNSIIGNTFVPASDALDSGAVVMDEAGSLVVYYKFDSPSQERINLIQQIVHTMMLTNTDWNE